MTPTKWTSCAVEGPHTRRQGHMPREGFLPQTAWDGHYCPSPLTLLCHPEEAESHAKRATPDEEPALSEAEGTYALALRVLSKPDENQPSTPRREPQAGPLRTNVKID
ncbi:MAG: hypothetical protein WA899_13145, partial [Candidatus Sulfotelmatobacter sp.]